MISGYEIKQLSKDPELEAQAHIKGEFKSPRVQDTSLSVFVYMCNFCIIMESVISLHTFIVLHPCILFCFVMELPKGEIVDVNCQFHII